MSTSEFAPPDFEWTAEALELSPDYIVLRRFRAHEEYQEPADPANVRMGLYLDCEATSLDRQRAEVIELGVQPFSYCPTTRRIVRMLPGRSMLEEPSGPIPEEVTRITRITDAMVQGHRIDTAYVEGLASSAALVIAHNAEYDRPILERRFPILRTNYWACAQREVPWESAFGCDGQKLVHVLRGVRGQFYEAHRALEDCQVGVDVLDATDVDGRSALSYLIESARGTTHRILAVETPYEALERIKSYRPRFRWFPGSDTVQKGWYLDARREEVAPAVEFLTREVYGTLPARIKQRLFTARDRYSTRMDQ